VHRSPTVGLLLALAACASSGGSRATPTSGAPAVPHLISSDSLDALVRAGPAPTLLDLRGDIGLYLRGHLPDAVYLSVETLRSSSGGVPNLLLPAGSYAALWPRLGVRADRPVVVYASGESREVDATYAAWVLAGAGHPRVYVLDGGFRKWEAESRRTERRYPAASGAAASAGWRFAPDRATLDDVRRAVERRDGRTILVDARVPEQYAGQAGAQMRRGHIPGAVNHYWQDDLTQAGIARVWRDRDTLAARYASQGITADKDVIVYCNSGIESSHVYFALRTLLGYPRVRVYDGSFTEWAGREELPVETKD